MYIHTLMGGLTRDARLGLHQRSRVLIHREGAGHTEGAGHARFGLYMRGPGCSSTEKAPGTHNPPLYVRPVQPISGESI